MNNQSLPVTNPAPQPNAQTPSVKKKMSTGKIVAIVIGILIIIVGVPILILSLMVNTSLQGAQDKAGDAKIKSDLSQQNNLILTLSDGKKSYQDLELDPALVKDVKDMGSNMNFKNNDQKYIIYAQLLAKSPTIYCMDSTGFKGEVTKVDTTNLKCQ